MNLEMAMPNDNAPYCSPQQFRLDFCGAHARLKRHIAHMALDKGIAVTLMLEADGSISEGAPGAHKVNLRNGDAETVVRVDHNVLAANDGYFYSFVLPKLSAAIDELAGE